jgi:hypothetical protein
MHDEIGWCLVFLPMAPVESVTLVERERRAVVGFGRVREYLGHTLPARLRRVRRVVPGMEFVGAVVTEIGVEHELVFSVAAESGGIAREARRPRAHVVIRMAREMVGSRIGREVEMVGIVPGSLARHRGCP